MQKQSFQRWLIQMAAAVFAITILSALGAAVFALLCGALAWVLRVERLPIAFLWATASGAIAGFLMGIMWAIDRIVNWRFFFLASNADNRVSFSYSQKGHSQPQQTTLDVPSQKIGGTETPAGVERRCPLPTESVS
jgi:hypothetical protein